MAGYIGSKTVVVGTNSYNKTSSDTKFVDAAGDTMTGDLSFGDNDKAIFGAGSDLQIYHDGSNSIIADTGTGDLNIRSGNLRIQNSAGTETFVSANENGFVNLYYDNSKKLATTSTGIDVTGTVTADGLTVDGNILDNAGFKVKGYYSNNAADGYNVNLGVTGNTGYLQSLNGLSLNTLSLDADTLAVRTGSSYRNRLNIGSGGDISFYEDTGTTPKFFWDASAESLTVGDNTVDTNGAADNLVISSTGSTGMSFISGDSDAQSIMFGDATNNASGRIQYFHNDNHMEFSVNDGSEAMRIDASGNVGIGTTVPSSKLSVNGDIKTTVDNTIIAPYASLLGFVKKGGTAGSIAYANGQSLIFSQSSASSLSDASSETYTERMRIDSSGNLLVGTTSSSSSTAGIKLTSAGTATFVRDGVQPVYVNRLTSDGDLAVFAKNGSTVGSIGTTGGSFSLGNADTGLLFNASSDNIYPWNMSTGAIRDAAIDLGKSNTRFKDLYLSGTANAANFNTTSDATLKTNVETLTGSLDAVNALRGVSFDWIENGGSEVGFIAQEVEEVLPEVVSTNDQGIKSVKYGNMVAVLVEALKEQQAQIDELKAKLEG